MIDGKDFEDLLKQVADEIVADGRQEVIAFWSRMKGDTGRINKTKEALARYAQHNLNALREPEKAEEHHKAAAHDLNAIISLGAAGQIEARHVARAYLDRVLARIFNTAEALITKLLLTV